MKKKNPHRSPHPHILYPDSGDCQNGTIDQRYSHGLHVLIEYCFTTGSFNRSLANDWLLLNKQGCIFSVSAELVKFRYLYTYCSLKERYGFPFFAYIYSM